MSWTKEDVVEVALKHGVSTAKELYGVSKEQIEAEGFEVLLDLSPYTGKPYKFQYKRDNGHVIPMHDSTTFTIEWYDRMRTNLIIHKQHRSSWDYKGPRTIYEGACPSINEFRKIMKLLGI